jgi:hypothetical protein
MSLPTRIRREDLESWLSERLLFFGGCTELAAASHEGFVHESDAGDLRAAFHLIVWELDESGAKASIVDVREQEVYVVPDGYRDEPARLRAFLDAWAAVMPEVLAHVDAGLDLMPHDLVIFTPPGSRARRDGRRLSARPFRQESLRSFRGRSASPGTICRGRARLSRGGEAWRGARGATPRAWPRPAAEHRAAGHREGGRGASTDDV